MRKSYLRTKRKLTHGVGTNDADYPVKDCPFYRKWERMLSRCYSAYVHTTHPNYAECEVTPEWLVFSNFKAWMETQDWEGKCLDKDIIVWDSKLYSPETCTFVSNALNVFLTDRSNHLGDYPVGVTVNYSRKKPKGFKARCMNPFTKSREWLGDYPTPEEAHEAWRSRKHSLALLYADMQTDPRVAEALRTRYLPDSPYLQSILPK